MEIDLPEVSADLGRDLFSDMEADDPAPALDRKRLAAGLAGGFAAGVLGGGIVTATLTGPPRSIPAPLSRNITLGSHNSCTAFPRTIDPAWPWCRCQDTSLKEQYALGVRWFDLRYNCDNGSFRVSHAHDSSYSLCDALRDLLEAGAPSGDLLYVRLMRDNDARIKTGLDIGSALETFAFLGRSLRVFLIKHGKATSNPWESARAPSEFVVLYCPDWTLDEDRMDAELYFREIFRLCSLWEQTSLEAAIHRVLNPTFPAWPDWGPRALLLDYAEATFPWRTPEQTFPIIWRAVRDALELSDVQYIGVNFVPGRVFY